MSEVFEPAESVILHSANQYPSSNDEASAMGLNGSRNKEMRAMTIAAFRVAQNNHQLSEAPMNAELLLFLSADSVTAVNYWKSKGRLIRSGNNVALTPDGLAECQNTLLGRAGAYSTTEEKVSEWVERMLSGDAVATRQREFSGENWLNS
jgi:hypothetical protein